MLIKKIDPITNIPSSRLLGLFLENLDGLNSNIRHLYHRYAENSAFKLEMCYV